MKICIVAPYNVLSLSEGASIRVSMLARGLNSCGASVYVLHHGSTKSLKSGFKFVNFKSCENLPNSGNYLHPLNLSYPPILCSLLKEYDPDIIQCEQPWSTFPTLFLARNSQSLCVLDEHNVEILWSIRASKVPFVAYYTFIIEKYGLLKSRLVLATSELDKKIILQLYKITDEKVFVIPNGVDLQRFSNISSTQSELKRKLNFNPERKIVLFHGIMSARQNYEAARLISDSIAPKIADATFIIIGKNPPQWLKMKAKKQRNVLVQGLVQNIEEYIMAADICIAPIARGSGTRLKVLEYLAAGKPIVATFKAVEGLAVINGTHGLLHKSVDEDFVNSVRRLLNEEQLSESLQRGAKRLCQKYDWPIIGKQLYKKYSEMIE